MKRQLFTLAALVLTALFGAAIHAQNPTVAYYYENFQNVNKTPEGMTLYDLDKNIIHPYLNGTGLECGTWHITRASLTDENTFMASTSYFTQPGQANDWMITPPIKIYSKGAKLSWHAIVCDGSPKLDGYKVYISTKGVDVSDFETEPLFSIGEESSEEWQEHEVSLDKYAGEIVYIAFVNDSYDKYVLAIDNIFVSGPAPDATFTVTSPIMTDTGNAQISASVTNSYSSETIQTCKLHYSHEGETFSKEFTNLNLAPGQTVSLTMDEQVNVPLNTSYIYKTWIEVDGNQYGAQTDSIRGTYFVSKRRTLMEEGTGNFCAWCPMGFIANDYMEKYYPDNYISISVHGTLSSLYYADYDNFCGFATTGYPMALTNRRYIAQPAYADSNGNYSLMYDGLEAYHLADQRLIAEAELSGEATLTDWKTNRIEVTVNSRFVSDTPTDAYDIALILIEDSVTAPDGTLYPQQNGYAGKTDILFYGTRDTMEACDGWAYESGVVRMKHNHVARAAYNNSFNGYDNPKQLPALAQGGETYTSTFTWDIPEGKVNNFEYTYVIALMTDAEGYIVNAYKMPVVISPESLATMNAHKGITVKGADGRIEVYTPTPADVMVYDAYGATVATAHAEGHLSLPLAGKGIHLVKVRTGGNCITEKIILE